MIKFKNHTIHIKPSFGYCILIIKKRAEIDPETMASIILTNKHFIKKGFYRFMIEVNLGVKSSLDAVDYLNLNGNHDKLEKLAIIDHSLNSFNRFSINILSKVLYLKGKVRIRIFKTKRKAAKWLKE